MDYCFDIKDKDFTTMLVKKYNMPCDSKGYIMWNPKYGNIPEDTKEYIKFIFSMSSNINYNRYEDVIFVLQLRHMAARASIHNLEYAYIDEGVKYSLIKRLDKIVNACDKLVELYRLKMGSTRYEAMKIHTIEDIFNYFK